MKEKEELTLEERLLVKKWGVNLRLDLSPHSQLKLAVYLQERADLFNKQQKDS